ncbi:unnamed protein product [Polarella glacialis]|uniref:Uncharacterized protein n=1 Tax=Polarella glacialis TaxID=89957 RepID=A0A813GGC4_POLGL|nr:unnamed protein product [Polarella glacialis]
MRLKSKLIHHPSRRFKYNSEKAQNNPNFPKQDQRMTQTRNGLETEEHAQQPSWPPMQNPSFVPGAPLHEVKGNTCDKTHPNAPADIEVEVIASQDTAEPDVIMQEKPFQAEPINPNYPYDQSCVGACNNACHLAGALRLLSHSDWPQGVVYPHPIHQALRHVAKNGKQNDPRVDFFIHRSLALLHPEDPHAQQDSLHTLIRILSQLTDPRFRQGFVSRSVKKEVCKDDTCPSEIAHSSSEYLQLAPIMDDEPFDLSTICSKFSSEFKEVDRKCTECGTNSIRGTNAFEEHPLHFYLYAGC